MGESIVLTATDGHQIGTYQATPAGPVRGRVVVIQEAFGVNAHIRNQCDRYAKAGYRALAPALYDRVTPGLELGYGEDDFKIAIATYEQVDHGKILVDVGAAVDHLQSDSSPGSVGLVGYCFGGYVAWLAAAGLDLACVASYYGGWIGDIADQKPNCPTVCHFGETDDLIPLTDVERIRSDHAHVAVHLYPAGHGFACDERDSFHPASATLANQRTLDLFAEHLS